MNDILSMNEPNGICNISKYFGNMIRFDFLAFNFGIKIAVLEKLKNKKGCIIMLEMINNLDDMRVFKFSET